MGHLSPQVMDASVVDTSIERVLCLGTPGDLDHPPRPRAIGVSVCPAVPPQVR
jgi:hypothetical protein